MNYLENFIEPSFRYRIKQSFSQNQSIEVPGILSVATPYLELTEITEKQSTDIVKLNISKNTATWKGISLNPKYISKCIKDIFNEYNSGTGRLLWFGFDLVEKYFICIFDGFDKSKKVIYWIPEENNRYKVISEFNILPSKVLEGKFIELIK